MREPIEETGGMGGKMNQSPIPQTLNKPDGLHREAHHLCFDVSPWSEEEKQEQQLCSRINSCVAGVLCV
jgi:hypothetical protein